MPASNQRVQAKGSIQVGRLLELERELRTTPRADRLQVRPRQSPGYVAPQRERWADLSPSGGIEHEQYHYSLRRRAGELEIRDQGLCQSYAVFGIPGSGKTYLLLHLLRQIVAHASDRVESRFGGLILDPKAALLEEVRAILREAGREDDLIVVNERWLTAHELGINVLDCFLTPANLGRALALAARSAGISSKEPYWLNQMGKLLGAGLQLLELLSDTLGQKPTLRALIQLMLRDVGVKKNTGTIEYRPMLSIYLEEAISLSSGWSDERRERFEIVRSQLARHLNDTSSNRNTLNDFIEQAFGLFADPAMKPFSAIGSSETSASSLYDQAIDQGKFILVSVSRESLAISKMLCTLIKTLFQQTVLTRLERFERGELRNFERPLLFLADEYSDVATEIEGEPMGDSLFFSQMRQFGCMGLLATQSVHMLRQSSLGEGWKSLFANLAAKIFMQAGDNETAEEASKLAGESEFRFTTHDVTLSDGNASFGEKRDLRDRKDLPPSLLTRGLERGQAVVIGSTDGKSKPDVYFVQVGRD
jgi:hypothetical protein